MKNNNPLPLDGLKGLKQNWKSDLVSGMIVSLLALPLSLGIAKASEFPPIMGVMTAIIGGMIVSMISGSPLTIKGPAAGLIVIVAGCVNAFGGPTIGWHLTLGAIVVAAGIQVVLGLLKLGKYSDYFPHTVIHGMLGAIGFIILSKQLHILMGVNPVHADGPKAGKPLVEPMELFMELPHTVQTLFTSPDNQKILLVGVVCLAIVFGWPMIKHKIIKKIPAPLVVLLVAIPMGMALGLKDIKGGLVKVENMFDIAGFNVSFDGYKQTGTFIKYVIMFALIGSIESLLTVKAIDLLDPYKRKSNTNKDVIAVGIGNAVSGVLGGLPMISEVARSSANVNNGAKTRWANFFHGMVLLVFVVVAVPLIELIPNAALAALLIGVGYRLASIKEFIHIFKIGWWQLVVLVTTTISILLTDLLVGVGIGLATKFIIHYIGGLPVKYTFRAGTKVEDDGDRIIFHIQGGAVVTNLPGIMEKMYQLPKGKKIYVDLADSILVDHTSMETFKHFKKEYEEEGGEFVLSGMNRHKAISKHQDATQFVPKEMRKEIRDRISKQTHEQRNEDVDHEHRIN